MSMSGLSMKELENPVPLGEEEIELVTNIQREAAILQGRIIGVLDSFIKRNGLTGRWELSANGKEIEKR